MTPQIMAIMKYKTEILISVIVLTLGSLTAAWVSQHVYGMQPCSWCVLQRAIFAVLAALALVGLWVKDKPKALMATSVLGIILAISGLLAALWQGVEASHQVSCNLSLADKILTILYLDQAWPGMFLATASCAEAAAVLWDVPYEYWSLGLFMLLNIMWTGILLGHLKAGGFLKAMLGAEHQSDASARR